MARRDRARDLDPEDSYREAVAAKLAILLEMPGCRKVDAWHRDMAQQIVALSRVHDPVIQAARDLVTGAPGAYKVGVQRMAKALLASLKK